MGCILLHHVIAAEIDNAADELGISPEELAKRACEGREIDPFLGPSQGTLIEEFIRRLRGPDYKWSDLG